MTPDFTKWRTDPEPHWTSDEIDEWAALLPTLKTGPGHSGAGRTCIMDIEGDGILRREGGKKQVTKLHCIGATDVETGEKFYWGVDQGPDSIEHGLKFYSECAMLLGHHAIGYDYPAIEELYPWWKRPAKAWDTLVIAMVVWPPDTLIGPDLARIRAGQLKPQHMKAHSLEAWGYRLGTLKVEYSGGFDEWRPAMASYLMTGDMDVPMALWALIKKRIGWSDPKPGDLVWPELTLEVENEVARIIVRQELDGVRFDTKAAIALSKELLNTQARIEKKLVETFGSWWQPLDDPDTGTTAARTTRRQLNEYPDITVPRFSEKTGKELKPYVGPPLEEVAEGNPFVRVERITFNPASRDHLGQRLQAVFGWKPKAFGKDGKPTVDESTLAEIPDAVMPAETRQLILDYFVVSKTYGMLTKGRVAWLNMVSKHEEKYGTVSRIHGSMDTCGAVTRRGIHKQPNLSQVPKIRKEKVKHPDGSVREEILMGLAGRYGYECRALFTADEGWEQTGVDASALELIDLGHYLYPLDGGAFSERVCDPDRDPHGEHAALIDLTRDDTKTATYLKVYGGGAYKLSLDRGIVVPPERVPSLLGYKGLPALLKSLEKRFDADFVRKLDDMQKARIAHSRIVITKLESGIEGLKKLTDDVTAAAARGWLKAIDGSRIHVRKAFAALNSLLQSAGAISCKLWIMLVHRELAARGLKRGVDFKQVLWSHDELQFTHRPGLGPVIKEVAQQCMVRAGEMLGLRGRYRTEGKTGRTWAECH